MSAPWLADAARHYGRQAADLPGSELEAWSSKAARDDSEICVVEIERAELRRVQYLIVLLSCLPRGGKCREVLELALALDEEPQTARLKAQDDLVTNDGVLLWLESLWAREDLSPAEREVVWWQNDGQNMDAAIRELKEVEARLGTAWTIAPSALSRGDVSGAG